MGLRTAPLWIRGLLYLISLLAVCVVSDGCIILVSQIQSWLFRNMSSGAVGMWGLNGVQHQHHDSAGRQDVALGSGGVSRVVSEAPVAPRPWQPEVSAHCLRPLQLEEGNRSEQ